MAQQNKVLAEYFLKCREIDIQAQEAFRTQTDMAIKIILHDTFLLKMLTTGKRVKYTQIGKMRLPQESPSTTVTGTSLAEMKIL